MNRQKNEDREILTTDDTDGMNEKQLSSAGGVRNL